jgi:seryl-tRNA synthetase
MIDLNLVRENPKIVRENLKKRDDLAKLKWVDKILDFDLEWKNLKTQVEELRHMRNKISQQINQLKKEGKDATNLLKQATEIPEMILQKETAQKQNQEDRDKLLRDMPNLLHESVPQGTGEEGNVTLKEIGKKPKFDFKPKSHVDLIEELGVVDLERAANISGARFWFMKGDLARLDMALQQYAIDFLIKKGFTLIQPPFMMNRSSYEGVTDLGDFENVMYKIEGEDLYLIATSEHPLTGMFQNELMMEEQFPIQYAGVSACFRKEAGSHGKDTKGIFRGHQFNKIEQVVVCKPEESWDFHEKLLNNAVEFFESLELPFRIVNICTGDIGTVAAKKYDLECWMPAQQAYREVVSCSNCTDYQARRLKIRYKDKEGKKVVPHTLNSTCVATSRAMVAILENFQNKEGSVDIPKVLHPFMGGVKKIEKQRKKENKQK